MTRAGRNLGRLVALGSVGLTGVAVAATPAQARPAEAPLPPVTVPPVAIPPVPPLAGVPELGLPLPDHVDVAPVLAPANDVLEATTGPPGSPPATSPVTSGPPPPAPAAAAAGPATSPPVERTSAPRPRAASSSETAADVAALPSGSASTESMAMPRTPAEAVTRAAHTFTPLFLLAGVVAAFLVAHGRVDRRDAKLAAAPVDDELLEFR